MIVRLSKTLEDIPPSKHARENLAQPGGGARAKAFQTAQTALGRRSCLCPPEVSQSCSLSRRALASSSPRVFDLASFSRALLSLLAFGLSCSTTTSSSSSTGRAPPAHPALHGDSLEVERRRRAGIESRESRTSSARPSRPVSQAMHSVSGPTYSVPRRPKLKSNYPWPNASTTLEHAKSRQSPRMPAITTPGGAALSWSNEALEKPRVKLNKKRPSILEMETSADKSRTGTKKDKIVPLGTPPKEKKGILRSLSFQVKRALVKMKELQFTSFGRRPKDNEYDTTPELTGYEELGPILGVQCYGVLYKKYKKKNRPAKWSKRFFVLKECFLLYYAPSFRKNFEKSKRIDLHPKGIIPLIGCSIVCGGDVGRKHCLLIAHPQFSSAVIVSAEDHMQQDRWLQALRNATKVSYKNTLVGESVIRELESRGLLLNEEKKTYEEKLAAEAAARHEEHERNLSLEKMKTDLEEEREKLIRTTKKLKDDLQNVKNELKLTNETKRTLEQEKLSLNSKTEHLQANMESLNIEKEKIQEQMSAILRERYTSENYGNLLQGTIPAREPKPLHGHLPASKSPARNRNEDQLHCN